MKKNRLQKNILIISPSPMFFPSPQAPLWVATFTFFPQMAPSDTSGLSLNLTSSDMIAT